MDCVRWIQSINWRKQADRSTQRAYQRGADCTLDVDKKQINASFPG